MKYLIFLLVAVLVFGLTLAGALAMTGNLNGEALARMVSGDTAPDLAAPGAAAPSDPLSPLAQQLKRREDALKEREDRLKTWEAQLLQREGSLEQMRTELEALQKQLNATVDEADAERKSRIEAIAITMEKMRPERAAERLLGLPTEEAAEILALVKDKSRGKIIESMDADQATRVLRMMQERSF
jgi:flagellar motility protein MotE (MotC chaperone)